jgi:hypothetical protein
VDEVQEAAPQAVLAVGNVQSVLLPLHFPTQTSVPVHAGCPVCGAAFAAKVVQVPREAATLQA